MSDPRQLQSQDGDRLLTAVYDSGMDERITETLSALGVRGWTKFYDGHGSGGVGLKENTAIFPGTVHMLSVVLPVTQLEPVVEALRALQRSYRRNPGMTLWSQAVHLHPSDSELKND